MHALLFLQYCGSPHEITEHLVYTTETVYSSGRAAQAQIRLGCLPLRSETFSYVFGSCFASGRRVSLSSIRCAEEFDSDSIQSDLVHRSACGNIRST
jgi:hypothetical protein